MNHAAKRMMMDMNGSIPIDYLIRDMYTTNLAAGSVNGTAAEPGPGTRIVVDTAGTNLFLSSGICNVIFTATRDPYLRYSAITRTAGRIAYCKRAMATGGRAAWGLYILTNMSAADDRFVGPTSGVINIADTPTNNLAVGDRTDGVYYEELILLRTTGAFFLVRGGVYPVYTLLWAGKGASTATLYLGHTVALGNYLVDEIALVSNKLYLPSPLVSDGMSSASATDGLGHAETTGLGSGGAGLPYSDTGTWGVSGGARSCSALSGGLGIDIVNCGKADVFHYAGLTRSAGNIGIVVRYTNSSNYIYAYHDGTNITLRKMSGGSDSQVLAPTAAVYSAGADLYIVAYGTKFRVFYNNAAVGAEQTIADAGLQSGTGVGLYTTDTGNTFDNMVTYARGTGGEYEGII